MKLFKFKLGKNYADIKILFLTIDKGITRWKINVMTTIGLEFTDNLYFPLIVFWKPLKKEGRKK